MRDRLGCNNGPAATRAGSGLVFDEIDGLPVHVLVVHAAVVVLPLAAVLGVLYVIPRTREWARVPFLLTAVAAVPLVFVARESGKSLQAAIQPAGEVGALVAEHQDRSDLLFGLVIGYAIVAVLVVAATLTPPDPISQLGLALPLMLLYEVSIISVKLVERSRRKALAAAPTD